MQKENHEISNLVDRGRLSSLALRLIVPYILCTILSLDEGETQFIVYWVEVRTVKIEEGVVITVGSEIRGDEGVETDRKGVGGKQ